MSGKDKGKSAATSAQAAKKATVGKTAKGGKTKKKTWTKVKIKDKLNNEVFLDEKRFAKICQEVPKILCVTRSALMEKFKINGSVARGLIKHLSKEGSIKRIGDHSAKFDLFSGVQAKSALEKAAEDAAALLAKQKK